MRFIIRYLTPFFRSRRRFSVLLACSLFFIIFLLFINDHNTQPIDTLTKPDYPLLLLRKNQNIILDVLKTKTTEIIQK